MYTPLILFGLIIFPIPPLVQCIRQGRNPYNGVLSATVAVGLGSLMIFIYAVIQGSSVAAELEASVEAYMPLLLQSMPGQEALLRQSFDSVISTFPSTIMIWGAVVAYLEYLILSKFIRNGDKGAWQMARLREFTWPRNGIYGWMMIFILSWIASLTGMPGGDLVMLNIQNIFEAAFSLQGVSLFLMFCMMKKVPSGVAIGLGIIAWVFPTTRLVLFLLGIADIMLGLRTRISQR